jgi:hypothetical protein
LGTTIGYKLAITDRFHLDFIMAGPGTSYFNFAVENNIVLPERFYDELNDALEKHSLFDVLNPDFNFKWRSSRSKFRIPSFRYGLTIGFAF